MSNSIPVKMPREKMPLSLVRASEDLAAYYETHMPSLAPLAAQCFLNTIETTVKQCEDGSWFVITGDIPAMWLRDSAAQVKPYIPYAKEDPLLQEILESVILKQAAMVCVQPYANAFNQTPNGAGWDLANDDTFKDDWVWECKYEVDSLCAPLYLSHEYWKTTGSHKIFTETFHDMLKKIAEVFAVEQDHDTKSPYYFTRNCDLKSETLVRQGKGRPVNHTGMTWSGFRPSDDACKFGYLVPSNMMAAVACAYGKEIALDAYQDETLAKEFHRLACEIDDGIQNYGIVRHPVYGEIYAYETDGYGNYNLMDDANSPSLLAAPYLGYCKPEDPLYQRTRKFLLSDENPYYYKGVYASGMGSPHTPAGWIWPIGVTMQILTSQDAGEILSCLNMLSRTHGGTNYMHESFHPDRPDQFTRPWFAWANTLFAQMLSAVKNMDIL